MGAKDLGKSSTGLEANVAACLAYVLTFVTGLVFYLIEKENKFVRFHALQSLITFGALLVINLANALVLSFLPWSLRGLISTALGMLSFILWIVLMIKAYQGEKFKLPIVGDIAEQKS
jgi:uncharacterized membrane protein